MECIGPASDNGNALRFGGTPKMGLVAAVSTLNPFAKPPTDGALPQDSFERQSGRQGALDEPTAPQRFRWHVAGKNFVKGLISPIAGIFDSPKAFVEGLAIGAVGLLAMAALGSVAGPAMMAVSLVFGGLQVGISTYKMCTAKTTQEKEQACYGLGVGTSALGFIALAGRAMLKPFLGSEKVEGMNLGQVFLAHLRHAPASVRQTIQAVRSGRATNNLRVVFGLPERALTESTAVKAVSAKSKRMETLKAAFQANPPIQPLNFGPKPQGPLQAVEEKGSVG